MLLCSLVYSRNKRQFQIFFAMKRIWNMIFKFLKMKLIQLRQNEMKIKLRAIKMINLHLRNKNCWNKCTICVLISYVFFRFFHLMTELKQKTLEPTCSTEIHIQSLPSWKMFLLCSMWSSLLIKKKPNLLVHKTYLELNQYKNGLMSRINVTKSGSLRRIQRQNAGMTCHFRWFFFSKHVLEYSS